MQHSWKLFNFATQLREDEAHIVLANVPHFMVRLPDYQQFLNREESLRYQLPQAIIARGLLRELLACYLNCVPKDIQFHYNAQGKPNVASIQFNISHAKEKIIFIFHQTKQVGIDIEYTQRPIDYLKIAHRFFFITEYHFLQKQLPEKIAHMFFTIWTLKEAYVKAHGKGVSAFRTFSIIEKDKLTLTPTCSYANIPLTNFYQGTYVIAGQFPPNTNFYFIEPHIM